MSSSSLSRLRVLSLLSILHRPTASRPATVSTPLYASPGAGLLRLCTNKTVCQAALTLHPYRLSDLRHFMSGSLQPPQTPATRRGMLYALLHHRQRCLLGTIII